jgi:hypothetical protein
MGPPFRPRWPSRCDGRRQPRPDRRRALELLAGCGPEGCSEHVLRAHGFTTDQLVVLVRSGFATNTAQRVKAGGAGGTGRLNDH